MATLYVDPGHPSADDARPRASNTASLPWETIGRAAWGSTDRSSPDTGECAQAGDTVIIVGGSSIGSPVLYTTAVSIGNNGSPVYLPAVTGSVGNLITFRAEGFVQMGAHAANAPIVGTTTARQYVKWFADRADSRFLLVCDGRGASDDTKGDTSVVNPKQDTGPVFLNGYGGWIEGFDIDGGEMIDWVDNWEGIRMQNANDFTVRRNYVHDFRRASGGGGENTNHNQAGITVYGGQNGLIERNLLENNGVGVYFKDRSFLNPNFSNTVRYNWIASPAVKAAANAEGIAWSLASLELAHDRNDVYQNIIVDVSAAFDIAGMENDYVYNNTIARATIAVQDPSNNATGVRMWNNIFVVTSLVIAEQNTIGDDTEIDFEHNVYDGFGSTFADDSVQTYTFAQWLAAYASHDHADPDSVSGDPLCVNPGADDFHLQGSSPALNLGRHPDTSATINAGAYITGDEQIGLGDEDDPAPAAARVHRRLVGGYL